MNATANGARLSDWLAGAAALLAILACYGTMLVIVGLSLLGVTLAVDHGVWAGIVSLFALLALAGVILGYRRHYNVAVVAFALLGAALVIWSMFGHYDWIVELAGLAALAIAAIWDWRLKRSPDQQENRYAGIDA